MSKVVYIDSTIKAWDKPRHSSRLCVTVNSIQLALSINEKETGATYGQADEFLVISFHASEDLLAVASELVQLLLDDGGIQWLTLLYQLLPLGNDLLDFIVVQRDLLLESLRGAKVMWILHSSK